MDLLQDIRASRMSRFQVVAVTVSLAMILLDGFDVAAMAYAAPSLSTEWQIGDVMLGYLLSASLFGMAAGSIFFTPLADVIGRRRLAVASMALIAVGMGASVMAGGEVQLLIFRLLTGLGVGGMMANLNVLVSEYASDARRGSIIGIYAAGYPIGATIGGLVAEPLITAFGWHAIFLAGAVLSALMFVLALLYLPESLDFLLAKRPPRALERTNAILARMGRPALAELPTMPVVEGKGGGIGEIFRGAVMFRTLMLWFGYAFLVAAYYFANTWTPQIISTAAGDSGLGIRTGTLTNLGGIIGCFIFSALAVKFSSHRLLFGSLAGAALAYVLFGTVFSVIPVALGVAVLLGILTTAGIAGFYAVAPGVYTAHARATGIGWMIGIGRLVSIVAPILVGYLIHGGWAPQHIFFLFAAPLLASAACVLALSVSQRREQGRGTGHRRRTRPGDRLLDSRGLSAAEGRGALAAALGAPHPRRPRVVGHRIHFTIGRHSMNTTAQGTLLTPAPPRDAWATTRMGRFLEEIEADHGVDLPDYDAAWRWSVEHLEDFWQHVWDHFEVISHSPHTAVLEARTMPGARWFPGATLNYAEHVFRALRRRAEDVMVTSRSQTNGTVHWTGQRLLEEVARIQAGLVSLGVRRGDRVAAYLPNIPETLAAYLATTALGALWCAVPPEMGPHSVLDRLTQLDPKVLLAIDGYTYGKRDLPRDADLARIRQFLPNVRTVLLPYLDPNAAVPEGALAWDEFTGRATAGSAVPELRVEPVPFDHPLTVLFSSGTTGRPKAIVHCHGGILLEHLKAHGLHFGMSEEDRAFWFTTTGWMVWTMGMSSLLLGASLVLMDGDPNWPAADGEWSQWAVLAQTGATYLGTGAAYLGACAHAGLRPGSTWDLSRVREIQCSGSPLAADVAGWVLREVDADLRLAPTSGGTDICAAFLGGSPLTEVRAGEMSCRPLGVAVESWDPDGRPLHGEPGELVCTAPLPSMPAFFWGDVDHERYLDSYFGAYPGVWRHGDWLTHTEHGGWVISGRSDATLNRGGVRLGTAEFYAVLDALPQVRDAMVLHFEDETGMGQLVLLIDAAEGADEAELERRVRGTLRTELSPRHVPDSVVFVASIPRNPTGKRLEIPLKRIIQGAVRGEVMDLGVVARPEQVDETVARVKQVLAG